jgi:hypothetical protein
MASIPLTPTPYRRKIPRLQKYGKKKQRTGSKFQRKILIAEKVSGKKSATIKIFFGKNVFQNFPEESCSKSFLGKSLTKNIFQSFRKKVFPEKNLAYRPVLRRFEFLHLQH